MWVPLRLHRSVRRPATFARLLAQGQEYFCPRLMAVDIPEAMGGMRASGQLFLPRGAAAESESEPASTWGGEVAAYHTAPQEPSALSTYLAQDQDEAEAKYAAAFASLDAGGGAAVAAPPAVPEATPPQDDDLGLDATARVWSDAMKASLHHRSVRAVPSGAGVGSGMARGGLDTAAQGTALWEATRNTEQGEDLADTFRHWLEASDALSGLHVLADADGGWGGFAGGFLEEVVRCECPKLPLLAVPITRPWDAREAGATSAYSAVAATHAPRQMRQAEVGASPADLAALRDLSIAHTLHGMLGVADMVVPLGLEGLAALASVRRAVLGQDGGGYSKLALGATVGVDTWFPALGGDIPLFNPYHSSALLAAGLDLATLPHRRKPGATPPSQAPGGAGGGPDLRMLDSSTLAAAAADARAGHAKPTASGATGPALIPTLPPRSGLRDTLAALSPTPSHRLAGISLALPFPHPAAAPDALAARLQGGGALGGGGLTSISSLALAATSTAGRLPTPRKPSVGQAAPATTPAGQYLVLRSDAAGAPGTDAVLQGVLADHGGLRAGARAAACSVPLALPLPITFPRQLFQRQEQGEGLTRTEACPVLRYTRDGGVVQMVSGKPERVVFGQAWGAGGQRVAGSPVAWEADPLSLDAAQPDMPFTVAALAHVSTAPSLQGPVRSLGECAARSQLGQHAASSAAAAKAAGRFAALGSDLAGVAEELLAAAEVLAAGHSLGAPHFGDGDSDSD